MIKNEFKLEDKKLFYNLINNNDNFNNENNEDEIEIEDSINNSINKKWLKYNNYNCRNDSFFFLYIFIMNDDLLNIKNNKIIKIFNIISNDILKAGIKELNEGIWNINDKYKTNYNFLLD